MQIVTDSATNIELVVAPELASLAHIVPLSVTLDGHNYRDGIDLSPQEFYQRLASTGRLPVTSQPSAGEFTELYRHLAATDPEILSIHMSGGLSGTVNSATVAAAEVSEAHVTVVDTKTLSTPAGWQVEAALLGAKNGWPLEQILQRMERIRESTNTLFTLNELKYLIHGGRISHLKGLLAQVLNIKPVIGVEKERGTYVQQGQARSFKGAVRAVVDYMAQSQAPGSRLRVQVVHAFNPEGAEFLHDEIASRFECTWLPAGTMSFVLGAHTGPSMIGVAYAPAQEFAGQQ